MWGALLYALLPWAHGAEPEPVPAPAPTGGAVVITDLGAGTELPDLSRWSGMPVADVQLVGPEGGLPEASLAPLLRSTLSETLDLGAVRLDVRTLFQVGSYRSVEARVEPWFSYDDEGNEVDAVILTYTVYPAPSLSGLKVTGNRAFSDKAILDASSLSVGQVFYEALDGPIVAARVQRFLYQGGYIRAEVEVEVVDGVGLLIIDEGEPNLLQSLTFPGDYEGVVPERTLRRWARQAGVEEGKPFAPEAIGEARTRILERLGDPRGRLLRPRRGYIAARLTPAVITLPEGARATLTLEPGPKLEVDVEGLAWGGRRKVSDALDLTHRTRLTRGFLDEAPDRVESYLTERGFYDAGATVELQDGGTVETLSAKVERGPRYSLPTGRFPSWVGMRFDGNDAVSDAELQAIMDQASPDVIRRDIYTEPGLADGMAAARQLYGARGYLEAELILAESPRVRPRRSVGDVLRLLVGQPARRRIEPTIYVTEGELTTLHELVVEGASVPMPFLAARQARMEGEAYSAQAIDVLARDVLLAHRNRGWLDADTRIITQDAPLDDGRPQGKIARIVVTPREQILLRSVVVQGTRRTRLPFVQRELDLVLGEAVTPSALDDTRSSLYDLGIFRSVQLDLLGDGRVRDLVVAVDERARWAFEVGGGVNTDQGVRTFGRATRRNLLGLAHRLELIGQIGLDYRSESLSDWVPDVTDPEWRLAASYTAPHVPLRNQDLILDVVLRERRQELTWQLDRTGGGIAVESRLGRSLRIRAGARLEARQLREVDTGALLDGEVWADLINLEAPVLPSPWRLQESVSGLVVADLRNDPVAPTRGALVSATGNWAPGIRWAEDVRRTAFVKGELRASTWIPLYGFVLKVAGEGGLAQPLNDTPIPLEERYRIGGTGSLRGFRRDAVGPRNIAPDAVVSWPDSLQPLIDYARRDAPARWVPTGGDAMLVGTLELQMPLPSLGLSGWEGYSLALFGDVGQAWLLDPNATPDSASDAIDPLVPSLRYGVGGGVRVATPIGPLQFDVGVNPQSILAEGAQAQLLRVLYEEPPVRAHLTLGATF